MQISDLEALSFEDLWRLHEELTKVLAERLVAEKFELDRRLALLRQTHFIGESGTAEGEAESAAALKREHARLPPKYRNNSVAGETWSGRGKRPRWLVEAIKSGRELDEFRIRQTVQKSNESKEGDV